MTTKVVLRPKAQADLDKIQAYVAQHAGRRLADRFVDRILTSCRSLEDFPLRGAPRTGFGAGIRLIGLDRRVAILYRATGDEVEIVRIFYGGQDIAERLSER